jgi:carboxypeptidase C (cathepsin A)
MTQQPSGSASDPKPLLPTPAVITQHTLPASSDLSTPALPYTAEAGWLLLREHDRPTAEMFFTYYRADGFAAGARPLTFVFNGGPGASSAYLHMAALGPRRVMFNDDGSNPAPPARLADNTESWLAFTDLVFIDPIGTGYSRALDTPHPHDPKDSRDEDLRQRRHHAYWTVSRDLDSMCEFIQRFLTSRKRWGSPVVLAGESYGGYRVAKLAKKLQEERGVGLNGAIMISPALEFSSLEGNDYDVVPWCDLIPTMAAAAYHHGRARTSHPTLAAHVAAAETFARRELIPALALGAAMPDAERRHTLRHLADLIGLHLDDIERCGGRVGMEAFCRLLLRDQHRFLGRYDAAMSTADPFPGRDTYQGPDPTLWGMSRQFAAAIHMHLAEALGVDQDREYHLIDEAIFRQWKFEIDASHDMRMGFLGSADDLRYGIALNPHMHVMINHGYFDLVTPYFSSNRIADLLQLTAADAPRLTLQHFQGGHMFYTWRDSRVAFFRCAQAFYQRATQRA